MKQTVIILLIYCLPIYTSNREVCTTISPHSQSVNSARELAGWENKINILTCDTSYSVFSITPEVSLSFRPERIAQCFFGDSVLKCNSQFEISGSQTENRTQYAWLADYFGLPTDYKSLVSFEPRVSNVIIDLDYYIGLESFLHGLYARIHAPLVYARWDLGLCESLITTGSHAHDPGYFNPDGIPRIQLVDTFRSFISGQDAPKATDLTFHTLGSAKMALCSQRLVRLSDIQIALGYNIFHNKRYHLGGNIRCSIPTGNTHTGEYLFEPIIGNGHHWEVGGGLSSHIILWEDPDIDDRGGFYFDVNITHMFNSNQCRSFDVCDNPNSRYILAERMSSDISNNLRGVVDGQPTEPSFQYAQEITTVANLTTLAIDVSNSVQVDLALLLAYTKGKNSWTFGYGFWGRSCDKITLPQSTPFDTQSWALKGDAYVFGFEDNGAQTAVPLSATEKKATIHNGTNFSKSGVVNESDIATGQTNPNIDNPYFAQADGVQLVSQLGGTALIRTSIQPKILTRHDINCASAQTRGFANKIVSSFTHTIEKREIQPYLGFGGEIEFGQQAIVCTTNKPKSCINTALSFWAIWLKLGVSY